MHASLKKEVDRKQICCPGNKALHTQQMFPPLIGLGTSIRDPVTREGTLFCLSTSGRSKYGETEGVKALVVKLTTIQIIQQGVILKIL